MNEPIRIGVLISGGGTNLQAIIEACEAGKIDGRVVFVGSDNPKAYGLERARVKKIPRFVVNYAAFIRRFKEDPGGFILPDDFDMESATTKHALLPSETPVDKVQAFLKTRAAAEAALLKNMAPFPFDLLVLAGFMRNLTPYFIDRVNLEPEKPRIMNIHPALLPAFPGVDGYGDTFRYGCKIGGVTVHFVDYGEDSGPIIAQKTYEIREEDSLETVKSKGLALEWELYPEVIQMFARGSIWTVKMSYTRGNNQTIQRRVVKIARSVSL